MSLYIVFLFNVFAFLLQKEAVPHQFFFIPEGH